MNPGSAPRPAAGRPSDAAERFLDAFFSHPNRLTRAACAPGSGRNAAKFAPWLALALRRDGGGAVATVLPRWDADGSFTWYGVATDESLLRRLGEDLAAFVGPTWSTFRGQRADLDPRDPVEQAVANFTGGLAFRFADGGQPGRVFDALERMRRAWSARPAATADTPRAVGRVLRDFHMALLAGDRASAEEQLAYLRRRGQLTELNRLFLRVQMLDALGADDELLAMPDLGDLLQARRPLPVTQALLAAAYRRHVAPAEARRDAALAQYRVEVAPAYGPLFASEVGLRRPEALKLFMLRAAADRDPALRDRLLASPGAAALGPADHDALAEFATLLPAPAPPAPADPLAEARMAADAGDFGAAFALARGAPLSPKRALLLCECAFEAPSLEAEQAALESIFALGPADHEAVMRRRLVREFVESRTAAAPPAAGPAVVAAPAGAAEPGPESMAAAGPLPPPPEAPAPVDGWAAWLRALYGGQLGGRALDVARMGAEEWEPGDLAADPTAVAAVAESIASPPPTALSTLSEALPHLLAFFQRDSEWPRKAFAAVYGAAAGLIAQTSDGAADDLALFADLMAARLEAGAAAPAYRELLEGARALVESYSAPSTLDWVLDVLEAIAFHPCPDPRARDDLLLAAGTKFFEHRARVTPGQRWLLGRLYAEAGHLEVFKSLLPPAEEAPGGDAGGGVSGADKPRPDPLLPLAGKSVAVYTLNVRAGQVVEALLRERVPNVVVHVSNDLAGTPRLKALAQQADVFVMTLGSAKHAATDFIRANRAPGKPVLRTGKRSRGSSGIIAQLTSYASGETG